MVHGDCDQISSEVSERGGENRGAFTNVTKICKYKGHPKVLCKRVFVKFSTYRCSERARGHRGEVKGVSGKEALGRAGGRGVCSGEARADRFEATSTAGGSGPHVVTQPNRSSLNPWDPNTPVYSSLPLYRCLWVFSQWTSSRKPFQTSLGLSTVSYLSSMASL